LQARHDGASRLGARHYGARHYGARHYGARQLGAEASKWSAPASIPFISGSSAPPYATGERISDAVVRAGVDREGVGAWIP